VPATNDPRPPGVILDDTDWQTLCASAMFSAVDRTVLARLCGHEHPIRYQPHQSIFSQGDRADGFFLVLEGWVKLFRVTPAGDEAIVHVFTRGESFAEAVFFMGGAYPASAEAASPLRLLRIDAARFNAAIATDDRLATTLLASIAQHAERLFGEIASLKLLPTPRRLADFLFRQVPAGAKSATVILPYEKAMLAGRLGMTPESLSRGLKTLRKLGVEVKRDHILVSDVPGLAAYAKAK
jgi:CRP-like cAMP-binding protein